MTFYDKDAVSKRQASSAIESRLSQRPVVDDEHVEEVPLAITIGQFSDWGFEAPDFSKVELFSLKPFEMVDFPSGENIRCFGINEQNIVIITKTQRVFRWRFNDDVGCTEIEMPQEETENIGQKILHLGVTGAKQLGEGFLHVGAALVSGVQKNIFKRQSTVKVRLRREDVVESKLERLFLEPSGRHLLACSDQGENYHVGYGEEELRLLAQLKGKVVKIVIWDDKPTVKNFSNTLIVTLDNKFYTFSLTWDEEKQFYVETLSRSLFQLQQDRNISQIERLQGRTSMSLIITTDQSILVLSGPNDYEQLFAKYKDMDSVRRAEVPQPKSFGSMIHVCYSKESGLASNMFWTNGHSLQLYKFPAQYDGLNQQLLYNSTALKYAKKYDSEPSQAYIVNEQIYGIGVTEFHYYLLTFDTLTIISSITQRVVQYYDLIVKTMGNATGMVFDRASDCFWIYCMLGVYKLDTSQEDMEAWKLLAERKMFPEALLIAKKYDSPFYSHIAGLYADDLFENHKFMEAAKVYRFSSRSFEQIILQFASNQESGTLIALEHYLREIEKQQKLNHQEQVLHALILELMIVRLKNYQRMLRQSEKDIEMPEEIYRSSTDKVTTPSLRGASFIGKRQSALDNDIFQRLSQFPGTFSDLNGRKAPQADTPSRNSALDQIQEYLVRKYLSFANKLKRDVDRMLEEFAGELDELLVYNVLQPHGFFDECINFAQIKNNHDMVITHFINQEQIPNAIAKLKKLPDPLLLVNLIIKYSFVIMGQQPKEAFEILLQNVKKLDPPKLIGAILNVHPKFTDVAVAFLEHCIYTLNCHDTIVNNLLIYNITHPPNLDKIMAYLHKQEKIWKERTKIDFDLHFAQRIFSKKELLLPQISIFGLQGNYDLAVKTALNNNNLKVAKEFANKVDDEDKQKELWMMIAAYLLERSEENVKDVVQLTRETSVLKIEDLLPHFTENIKLEHFKTELCDSLRNYDDEIRNLKGVMQSYQRTQDNLKSELKMINNRYTIVERNKKCEECVRLLFQEQFVVFGCQHCFHRDCLWDHLKESCLDQAKLKRLQDLHQLLQNPDTKKISEDEDKFLGFFSSSKDPVKQTSHKKNLQQFEKEFTNLLSYECPYCGPSIVDTITMALDDNEKVEVTWDL